MNIFLTVLQSLNDTNESSQKQVLLLVNLATAPVVAQNGQDPESLFVICQRRLISVCAMLIAMRHILVKIT